MKVVLIADKNIVWSTDRPVPATHGRRYGMAGK
jgi:hypothetical protein